jgi:hypothetical protein
VQRPSPVALGAFPPDFSGEHHLIESVPRFDRFQLVDVVGYVLFEFLYVTERLDVDGAEEVPETHWLVELVVEWPDSGTRSCPERSPQKNMRS